MEAPKRYPFCVVARVCAMLVLLSCTLAYAQAPTSDPGMVLLEQIAHSVVLPKWKFLGVRTDNYGRRYFIFFAADTIRSQEKFTDVVVGSAEYQYGTSMSPESLISGIQEGKYRPGALTFAHIRCETERIEGFSEAKMFEDQLVAYVCAHQQKPGKTAPPH